MICQVVNSAHPRHAPVQDGEPRIFQSPASNAEDHQVVRAKWPIARAFGASAGAAEPLTTCLPSMRRRPNRVHCETAEMCQVANSLSRTTDRCRPSIPTANVANSPRCAWPTSFSHIRSPAAGWLLGQLANFSSRIPRQGAAVAAWMTPHFARRRSRTICQVANSCRRTTAIARDGREP